MNPIIVLPLCDQIMEEKHWQYLGHSLPKIALGWTPEGNRSWGRPEETTESILNARGLT